MLEPEGVASKVMRKLPDWACPNRLLAHVPDDKKQTCGFTVELKLAGEAMDSRNKAENEASRFFFDTKFFLPTSSLFTTKLFVIGTIVPIPIPRTGLPLEARLFCLLGGTEGGIRRRCRMRSGVVGSYWWEGQNAFSAK
jgi:hypothetical protein